MQNTYVYDLFSYKILHIPGSSASLGMAVNRKLKEHFMRFVNVAVLHSTKNILTEVAYFSNIYYHTKFQENVVLVLIPPHQFVWSPC